MKSSAWILTTLLLTVAAGRVEGAAGDILRRLPSPGPCPTGLAFDGTSLWLADRMTDLLYEIDPTDGRVIRHMPAPSYQIESLAAEGKYLWALDSKEKLAFKVNPETGVTERTIEIPGRLPQGLAFDGRDLWAADSEGDRIYRLSIDDGSTIQSFAAPSGDSQGLAFEGNHLWVSDRTDDVLYMVCPQTGRVLLWVRAPSKYARGLAFDGEALWNVDYQSDTIYRLVPHDATPMAATDPKDRTVQYVHQIRNYGPGELTSLDVYMAVPTDSDAQKLLGQPVFEPKPAKFVTDRWGQRIAQFHFQDVPAGQVVTTSMKLDVRLFQTQFFLVPEKVGALDDVPEEIKKQYLGDGTKFRITDERIAKTARQIAGSKTNCHEIAMDIFDHVIKNTRYVLDDSWEVAPEVLRRGTGSCSEYSFAFIALCRAAGLPARYVGSIVVRGDDASTDYGVFHRWPEVYLPGYGWVPMDPSTGRGVFKTPADVAAAIGNRRNGYLITTHGGGPSDYLQWDYNSSATWKSKGPCKIVTERFGEWTPLEPEAKK
ncbi:MAG: hypothetical protein JW809_10430 [Pirellulales bacterium]|nr:hypothetical protein [Pirellulales bacterium]